jgi:hypothetical protein
MMIQIYFKNTLLNISFYQQGPWFESLHNILISFIYLAFNNEMAQDRDQWRALVNSDEPSGSLKLLGIF